MNANKPGQTDSAPSLRLPTELAFYASAPHDCGYLPDKTAITVFADPEAPMDMSAYSALVELGFRRSGSHVYTPHCPHCSACLPARLPVARFAPNRNQRRNFDRGTDITVHITEDGDSDEAFALYQRYLGQRHPGGGMDDPSPEKYREFLSSPWAHTEFVHFRRQGRLIAVAVQDVLSRGLSSVYTFFDPDLTGLSLGRYALLWQIHETRRRGLPWLFLGYWIAASPKMAYKQEYRPIELFHQGRWQSYSRGQALPGQTCAPPTKKTV
ncbi:MAG TPA: arginyltransferase [Gammaproteobacteria bacterium]|nr:arginyltransferase [Gammaproteobacteria bacterium]